MNGHTCYCTGTVTVQGGQSLSGAAILSASEFGGHGPTPSPRDQRRLARVHDPERAGTRRGARLPTSKSAPAT